MWWLAQPAPKDPPNRPAYLPASSSGPFQLALLQTRPPSQQDSERELGLALVGELAWALVLGSAQGEAPARDRRAQGHQQGRQQRGAEHRKNKV